MAIVLRLTKNGALTHEELDGNFTDLNARTTILENNSANWSTAYNWGNHATAGYLTFYEETDPVFVESPAAGITDLNIANWSTAYNWGNHATAGYLTSLDSNLLTNLSDVDLIEEAQLNDFLRYNGQAWVADPINDNVDIHLNTADANNNQLLSWSGTDYIWVDQLELPNIFNVSISDTNPTTPNIGDFWWDSVSGVLKIYYTDADGSQWVDAVPQAGNSIAQNSPIAVGCIDMNANSPTWSGTAGYTVAKSGGDGTAQSTDVVYTLTFPSSYSTRTDYIVHACYDGTNWVAGNGAQLGVTRFADRVEFVIRRWNEDPLNLGEIMITIHDL